MRSVSNKLETSLIWYSMIFQVVAPINTNCVSRVKAISKHMHTTLRVFLPVFGVVEALT
jgi:hypothetical protein